MPSTLFTTKPEQHNALSFKKISAQNTSIEYTYYTNRKHRFTYRTICKYFKCK